MQNRLDKYKTLTLFVSPERLKSDLDIIKKKYDSDETHPLALAIIEDYEAVDRKLNDPIRRTP